MEDMIDKEEKEDPLFNAPKSDLIFTPLLGFFFQIDPWVRSSPVSFRAAFQSIPFIVHYIVVLNPFL